MNTTQWKTKKERSTSVLLKLSRWFSLKLGRRFFRPILYPICVYYLFFTPKSKKYAKYYLQKVLTRKVTQIDHFKHYFNFASVTLDRVYFLTGKYDYFEIKVHGEKYIKELVDKKQGAILLGAHLGSFEVLRALAAKKAIPLKVLMHLETSAKMTEYLHALNQQTQEAVISMGKPDSLLQAKDWLNNSGMIGILADRVYQQDKAVNLSFLNEKTYFSTGPFRLIELFTVPVIFFCGLYKGKNRYEIYFHRLEKADLMEYVAVLEQHVRKAPYNWFNFYDYWQTF